MHVPNISIFDITSSAKPLRTRRFKSHTYPRTITYLTSSQKHSHRLCLIAKQTWHMIWMGVRMLLHSFAQVRSTHSSLTWSEWVDKHHMTFILYICSLEGECWGYTSIAHIPILVISLFPFSLGLYYIICLSHLFSVCRLLASHLLTEAETWVLARFTFIHLLIYLIGYSR
jgi:hypothetical protein